MSIFEICVITNLIAINIILLLIYRRLRNILYELEDVEIILGERG